MCRNEDNRHTRTQGLHPRLQHKPVHFRHLEVHDQARHPRLTTVSEELLPGSKGQCVEPSRSEQPPNRLSYSEVVIDDCNNRSRRLCGADHGLWTHTSHGRSTGE